MSDNIDWEEYKKSVIPKRHDKLFERIIENPRIIKNREVTKLVNTQLLISNLDNKIYQTHIANRKIQKYIIERRTL